VTNYIVGDIQGCFDELQDLLNKLNFDSQRDCLWFCGDLVNRGNLSHSVLHWVMQHPDCSRVVLGNHDIYLLARLWDVAPPKDDDTMAEIYRSPERDTIAQWLRQQPVFRETEFAYLVHAGLYPKWSLKQAHQYADAIHQQLSGENGPAFLKRYFKNKLSADPGPKDPIEQLCYALRVFITMRSLQSDGTLGKHTGTLESLPQGESPWFQQERNESLAKPLYFGHWAAIGYYNHNDQFYCLDSGCVWGRQMTAVRPDNQELTQVPALKAYDSKN
jgi:bis(5'-nucleosyl)-tetraphosphatase (symmetrical)